MKKREILQKYYDLACHNLLCYSTTYGMDTPKPGFEKEWEESNKEVALLKEMLDELPELWKSGPHHIKFRGSISGSAVKLNQLTGKHFYQYISVQDRDGNERLFEVNYDEGNQLFERYDSERHERYANGKSDVVIFTISHGLQIVTQWEWAEK